MVETEQGSMLPMFGGLIFVAFIVIALAVEMSLMGQAYRNAAAVADAASEAGAAAISVQAAYETGIALDTTLAAQESRSVAMTLAPDASSVEVQAVPSDVCVTIRDQYRPTTLVFFGLNAIDIAVTSCAEPRMG